MGIYLIVALRNLLQARRRSLFLSLAVAMVTMLLVLLLGLSQGLTNNMVRSATTLASGHVNVGGFFKLTPGTVAPLVMEKEKLRRLVEENVPELDYVIDRHRGWAKMVSETGSGYTALSGIDPAEEGRLVAALQLAPTSQYLKDGGDETPGDLSRVGAPGTILLFASQARRLDARVGDSITIVAESMRGAQNSAEFTVVAIAQDMGMMSQWTAFVNAQAIADLYRLAPDTTGAVMLYLKDRADTEAVLARLQTLFAQEGYTVLDHKAQPYFQKFEPLMNEDWTGFRLDLTTWEDESSFLQWILAAFNGLSFFLVGVLLLIIVIGIMNTMWMSVRERTGEVGTLRAIGMGRSRVLALFVTEALILGLAASTAGGLLGGAAALGLDAARIAIPSDAARMILLSDVVHLAVEPGQIVAAIAAFTLVTGLSALWPAFRAARMRPVTAIHHVG